ncbi:MAG: DUF1254 domain-containing protein [Saprospiraceae bacterium]|nr:DUF1254 domain-containing protein [Candidatus Opimibacter skivensis]
MRLLTFSFLALVVALASCKPAADQSSSQQTTTPDTTIIKTAEAAFVFAMPLALMDISRKKLTNFESPVDGKGGPGNQMVHFTKFPDANFRDVVRPNADTYYNTASLDLSSDAMVLEVPNTNGRYYLLPMLDAWTNIFISPGKRTTGTEAQKYLISGPKWKGTVPEGLEEIKAPTNLVWMIGRLQVNSAEDGKKVVVPLEKQIKLTPLASYGKPYTAPKGTIDPNVPASSPNEQLENMSIVDFFNYVNALMVANPPAAADAPVLAEFAKIGVGPGMKFDPAAFDSVTLAALNNVPRQVVTMIKEGVAKGLKAPVNGWSMEFEGVGNFGTNYKLRAAISYAGLGANIPEDAIYPSCMVDSEGNPFDGANKYVIHFEKGKTPPVNAFWSLTMYDKDGYFTANTINRYAIGDRNNLKPNADGSVDIYVQHTSPGKDKENNWLPCPEGSFNFLLRMYWPKEEVLKGEWTPPGVQKVK